MRTLLHTEFVALLARVRVSQASFARLAGVTARQVQHAPRIAHARYHGTHIEVEFRAECTLDQNSR